MTRAAEQAWRAAFTEVLGSEAALVALALGFPVKGQALSFLPEAPELRGAGTWLDGSWVRPVVVPLRVESPGQNQELLPVRIGAWPALVEGRLALRGVRVKVPEDPTTLSDLAQRVPKGGLAELLRHNLSRHNRLGVADTSVLFAGAERLLDGLTEALIARLMVA